MHPDRPWLKQRDPEQFDLDTLAGATEGYTGADVREVVLEPAGGSWTIGSREPARDVRVNEDRGILAETRKVRRLPPPPQR